MSSSQEKIDTLHEVIASIRMNTTPPEVICIDGEWVDLETENGRARLRELLCHPYTPGILPALPQRSTGTLGKLRAYVRKFFRQ